MLASEELARLDLAAEQLLDAIATKKTALPLTPKSASVAASLATELRLHLMAVGETVATSATLVGGLVTPLAVTRLGQAEAVTVSRICTHEGCTVALPGAAGATLDCPCHGSRFLASGQVVNGPAARALSQFPTRIVGNEVVVNTSV
jgi:Rieske Fe-S protein